MPTLKLHQAVASALADNGIDTMFGLMGDANMFFVDSFVRDRGGRFIAAAHEAGAGVMALGYALKSGRIGVCSVTHGPAMTNTVTALVEGVKAQVPMLLICGDTDTIDREHSQNVAQRGFAEVAGAGFEQLRSPKTVAADVARAIRRAIVERRPIALNLPYEWDWSEVDYEPVRVRIPQSRAVVSASDDIDDAVGIIAAARRPLLLAGRGASSPEAKAALVRLATRIGAPLATTLKAKDLFAGEDCNLGIFGTVSTPVAVDVIMDSDCILAFGASLNRYTSSLGTFLKGKRVIQVNQEPTEVGKNIVPDAGLVGDPAAVAEIIHGWLDAAEIESSGFLSDEMRQKLADEATAVAAPRGERPGTLNYKAALRRLDAMLPRDRVVVTDGGRFMVQAWRLVGVPGPADFITTVDFGSIGLGLGHAIGAAQAAAGRPVVLVTGDGGFMHGGLVEFNTAVRSGTDLIVLVCNDGAYGAEHIKFHHRQRDPALVVFDWPDLAAVARSLGGEGITLARDDDFASVEQAIAGRKGPLLIDLRLDPECISE